MILAATVASALFCAVPAPPKPTEVVLQFQCQPRIKEYYDFNRKLVFRHVFRPLCPRGYIHAPAMSNTCRLIDRPMEKSINWSVPEEPVMIERTSSQKRRQGGEE